MNPILIAPERYEFCFPALDTLVLVEVTDTEVTVRATRDTFSEQRKASFVRELVAEGFIADSYHWFSPAESEPHLGVRWVVDYTWLAIPASVTGTARRFMLRLFLGGGLLWLALLGWLLTR